MTLNPELHTITALVVEYKTGTGRPTLGQCPLTDLPHELLDVIQRINARKTWVSHKTDKE